MAEYNTQDKTEKDTILIVDDQEINRVILCETRGARDRGGGERAAGSGYCHGSGQ